MSQLIIDSTRIVAEANASYNAKYKTDVTFQGVASKIQKWYLNQENFPCFTNNLLLKPSSINNCGLVLNGEDVYVLDKVNNGFAQFKLFGKDTTVVCSLKDTSNYIEGKSDNIKIADSLPQSGDFAGQICSLTTGATYVWTGSEWSSTAGTSTLPTPTSANVNQLLISTGSAWTATNKFPVSTASNQMLVSDGNGGWTTNDKANASGFLYNRSEWCGTWHTTMVPILKHRMTVLGKVNVPTTATSSSPERFHLAFNIQTGQHADKSERYFVDIVGKAYFDSGTLTMGRIKVCVNRLISACVDADRPMTLPWSFQGFAYYINADTNQIFLAIRHGSSSTAGIGNVKFTINNVIASDETLIMGQSGWTYDYYDVDRETLDGWIAMPQSTYIPIPSCTTDDNGKVLTVSNGVPTWVTPS